MILYLFANIFRTKLFQTEQIFTLQIKEYKALVKPVLKIWPQYVESTVITKQMLPDASFTCQFSDKNSPEKIR